MKRLLIILLICFLAFQVKAYNWNLLGPDSANITNICFGAALPYMVLCSDDGMYLYNYSTYETTFHTYGLPILGATHLDADRMLVVMGDGSWSDGIWSFDIQTLQFEVVEWIPFPAFLVYNEYNQTFYAGFNFGGLYSSIDGLTWTAVPYFTGKSCVAMSWYGDHFVVSEVSNVYNTHWSDDAGVTWNESSAGSPVITDMQFSQQGKLYGIFPDFSNSSGLWYSEDYGDTWEVEFWSDNMSAVGFDVFGHIFVGWESPTAGNEGIAYYNPNASPPGLNFYNIGLGNLNINKIKTNPTMSAPALFVCTDGGVYMSYDIVISKQDISEQNDDFLIYPNPIQNSDILTISIPKTNNQAYFQLFSNNGKLVLNKTFESQTNIKIQLELPEIESGIYYLKLNDGKNKFTERLIIY